MYLGSFFGCSERTPSYDIIPKGKIVIDIMKLSLRTLFRNVTIYVRVGTICTFNVLEGRLLCGEILYFGFTVCAGKS
jgi:hypothetical protein